jgi:hypothetical protein
MKGKLYVDMLEPISNAEDAVGCEVERVHPADQPSMLRELARRFGQWADKIAEKNDRQGVPER